MYSVVILEKYDEKLFSNGFSTDYCRYRFQLTTKKSQVKSSIIFAQNGLQNRHFIAYNQAKNLN